MEYGSLKQDAAYKAMEAYPRIPAKRLEKEINRMFTPYLFFHRERGEIELWSSCCMKHKTMDVPPRFVGTTEQLIMEGRHNDKVLCPWCGKEATFKEVGRLGKKMKLLEHQPVVILKAKANELYAQCYWARKDYLAELDAPPKVMLTQAIHFAPGRVECLVDYGKLRLQTLEGNYPPNQGTVTEPFTEGSGMMWHYVPYAILGEEEISKTFLRYIPYEAWREHIKERSGMHTSFCKLMAAASIWPRQIEMLVRNENCISLVDDLILYRRKNRYAIRWGENDPRKAFGLNKQELRCCMESGIDVRAVAEYKKLRRAGITEDFDTLKHIKEDAGTEVFKEIVKYCALYKLPAYKLYTYLDRFTGPHCCGAGYYGLSTAWADWRDYLTMADALGWDLTVETVRFPRNLDLAHQNAVEEINLRQEREMEEKDALIWAASSKGLASRRLRYNFTMAGWSIRIAEFPSEIVREGKTLHHCVGGYAERHMAGKTTILFLRPEDTPDTPTYTIEMIGENLKQIHGYGNEWRDGKRQPDPRETMRFILDPWLAWVAKGSRRKKDGTPIVPKNKKESAA